MDTEPPAKRRRRGKSPLAWAAAAADDDDDDDELCFEPVELSAKRDPGYRLSLQRAYADSRFQATMAHIFEKYSRDFDGIGDEIDFVSGEIVVDNGHLQNMRDEGDVGACGHESDEDQGILLGHLMDDEDERYRSPCTAELLDTAARNDEQEQSDEEDDIMFGRKPAQPSQPLVPVARPQPSSRGFSSPSLLGGLCGAPLAFGASPLAFGVSPLAGLPWSLAGGLSGSAWDPPSISPRAPRLLPSPGERYSFPAQDCGSSIWAPNYRFKENDQDVLPTQLEFGSMRRLQKTRTRPMKSICPSVAPTVIVDEEIDEDAILTGKSSSQHQLPKADATLSRQDDLDDIYTFHTSPTGQPAAKRGKCNTPNRATPQNGTKVARLCFSGTSSSRKRKNKGFSQARSASVEAPSKPRPPDGNSAALAETRGQREAGTVGTSRQDKQQRSKKRTRDPARKQRPARHRFTVEISPLDQTRRDEYEEVEDAVEEIAGSADEEPEPAGGSVQKHHKAKDTTEPEHVDETLSAPGNEPVLQNGAAADDGVREKKAPGRRRKQLDKPDETISPAFCLSDDEMPIWSKPKKSATLKKLATQSSPPGRTGSGVDETPAVPSSTEDTGALNDAGSPNLALASGQSEKRRRPRNSRAVPSHDEPPPAQLPSSSVESHDCSAPAAPVEDNSRRLTRELRWLRKLNGPDMDMALAMSSPTADGPPHPRPPRRAASGPKPGAEEPEPVNQLQAGAGHDMNPSEAAVEVNGSPADQGTEDAPRPPAPAPSTQEHTPIASPTKPAPPRHSPTPTSKPQTPRHAPQTIKAPSSRRSILSLVSSDPMADDDADESDLDELGRSLAGAPPSASFLSTGASRKIWKSSARTTEIYHTPVKRRATEALSPGSIIKTPGGTLRACGIAGFRCGRDFCFTCL